MAVPLGQLIRDFAARSNALGLTTECIADGSLDAEIVVISEAPGQREVEMRTPLVGGSGRFLWDVLRPLGIDRRHCYITNVVKKRISDDVKKAGISKNEVSHWEGLLRWELSHLTNAKYFLLLGNYALHAMLQENGIDQWRGSVVSLEDKHYICAHNPANILRKPMLEPIFRLDCMKLDMVRRGRWQPYHIQPIINPSPTEAVQWCDKMIQEQRPISLDIEVISGETACVGLANDRHTGMCINFRSRESNRWTLDEERRVRIAIQRVLGHAKSRLVAQNGGFDCGWLAYKDRIQTRPLYMDTLLAHHTLHPMWPHNLGFLTAQYTTHPFYKDEKDAWREGGNIDTFWEYNVKDICITLACSEALERDLKHQGLWDFFQGHVMRLQPHLVRATVLGNRVDLDMRARLDASYAADIDKLEAQFQEAARAATGEAELNVNPNSPKQLTELFFTKLRLVGKTLSTNDENREAMINNPRTSEAARHMLRILGQYKEQYKLYSTYIKAKVDEDGRMRSDYKQYGTQSAPGRLSSAQTLWGSGMNLQNQPERLRGMFIADRMTFDD